MLLVSSTEAKPFVFFKKLRQLQSFLGNDYIVPAEQEKKLIHVSRLYSSRFESNFWLSYEVTIGEVRANNQYQLQFQILFGTITTTNIINKLLPLDYRTCYKCKDKKGAPSILTTATTIFIQILGSQFLWLSFSSKNWGFE